MTEENTSKESPLNLSQYAKQKKGFANEFRRLIITISIFLVMQIIFIAIDGSSLEPNLNKLGNFTRKITENSLFDSLNVLYENLTFKFLTAFGLLHILCLFIKTITLGILERKSKAYS